MTDKNVSALMMQKLWKMTQAECSKRGIALTKDSNASDEELEEAIKAAFIKYGQEEERKQRKTWGNWTVAPEKTEEENQDHAENYPPLTATETSETWQSRKRETKE